MNAAAALSLEGKGALVTGGSGGIGRAVVATLIEAGAKVLSIDLEGRDVPAGAVGIACDLADADSIDSLAAPIDAQLEGLDLVVHCAGVTRDGMLWKMQRADWERVMRVNLDSAFHLLHMVTPRLRARGGGSVVLLSSINGERGKLGQSNYAASKAGLIALGKTAAIELGHFGVRVNCVAPGLIRTPMTESLPPEVLQRAVDETALGRTGSPEDVANAVLFLCSDLSGHITGQVLRVDGGQLTA